MGTPTPEPAGHWWESFTAAEVDAWIVSAREAGAIVTWTGERLTLDGEFAGYVPPWVCSDLFSARAHFQRVLLDRDEARSAR